MCLRLRESIKLKAQRVFNQKSIESDPEVSPQNINKKQCIIG